MDCEIVHSPPSPFCPAPQWWHSLNISSTEIEVSEFIGGLVRLTQPEICVETGSYHGQTSKIIAEALQKNGHGKLYSLEVNEGYLNEARFQCSQLPAEFVLRNAEHWTPPGDIDFLYLDSGGDRFIEFEHYLPFLPPDSFFALHDTRPENPKQFAFEMFQKIKNHSYLFEGIEFRNPRGFFLGKMK